MTCIEKLSLGAYALGTLDPAERAAVEAHLDRCGDCRAALAEFAPIPGLLARVPAADLYDADPVVPSEAAFGRLVAAARAQRRTRRRRFVLAAAAGLVIALAAGAVFGVWAGDRGAPAATTVAASQGAVHARAAVSRTDGGSSVKLWLRGVAAEERCRLVAVGADGHREIASSWEATYSGNATVTGTVSIKPRDLKQLVIETFDGRTLVTMPVRA